MTAVLFVCMGNICRSPSAEGYFRHHLRGSDRAQSVRVDSAGTHSYHVGSPPDRRAISTMRGRGIDISGLRARQVSAEDFQRFDWILAMDRSNLEALRALDPGTGAQLALMLDFGANVHGLSEVPDPYYGGQDGFELMCDLLDEATADLLAKL